MKKIICILLILTMLTALTACNNKEQPQPTVNHVGTIAKFEVNAYIIDEWKDVDENDETKTYNKIIMVHTDGYYDHLTSDDVKYNTVDGNKNFTDAIEGSIVEVLNINENKKGTCAYITIKTPKLVDMKKVSILVEGPATYEDGVTTKDEYVEKHGNDDEWHATLTTISSRAPIYKDIELSYKGDNNGLIRLFDNGRSQYWYNIESSGTIKDQKLEITLDVIPLKNTTIDDFVKGFSEGCYLVNIKDDGTYEDAKLDERLDFSVVTDDGHVIISIFTKDKSDIADYDGEIPDAIIYNNNYIVHEFSFNTSK